VGWDLDQADKPVGLKPSLATSWAIDPSDHTKWTFKLRDGVKFHDGSSFDADAVVWNFDKILNKSAPQYDPASAAQTTWRIPTLQSYRKIDASTVEITTKRPDSTLPYQLTWILMSSPARFNETKSWAEFAKNPSGTGPWTLERYVPREQAVLKRNDAYWDKTRVPKSEHLVFVPIPDPATRTAALLSGQVNWIESPSPDAVPQLKAAGMEILTGTMPHVWPYKLNFLPTSALSDIRVRKALNLAIDRDGLVTLLGGLATPAKGVVPTNSPWFGKPTFDVHYDPAEAKRLLKEAGYDSDKHRLKLKFAISNSGSGQMYPLPMNEFVQQNFRDVGVDLDFEILEWQTFRTRRDAGGAKGPSNQGLDGMNNGSNSMDPFSAFVWHVDSRLTPPVGLNWGFVNDPEIDKLCDALMSEFDTQKQVGILQKLNEKMVDEAVWIFVVHDVNPRAIAPTVKGVIEAQSWFVDFSPVTVEQ
jgi:ABC-type transport system substrate-binding protein